MYISANGFYSRDGVCLYCAMRSETLNTIHVQAVSRRGFSAEVRLLSPLANVRFGSGKSGNWTGFSLKTAGFRCQFHYASAPHFIFIYMVLVPKGQRSKPANLCSALSGVRKHWIEWYFSLSKLLFLSKCWSSFQVLNCFRVVRVELSWYELNKRFPLSLNSNKFLLRSCAVTLTRKQTLAVLDSRDYFHYSYVFMFFILLWQGRAGEAWENFYKMMLLLPSPNKSVSHLSLVFPFCLFSYFS
jgi:hypothetical protein